MMDGWKTILLLPFGVNSHLFAYKFAVSFMGCAVVFGKKKGIG